jgi:hypothetical protein
MGDVVAENVQARRAGDCVTYTARLRTAKVSVNDGLAAQILDCYV